MDKVLANLIVFFKSTMQSYILGFTSIFICPICDKPCLQENEFELDDENSIECAKCLIWYHWKCCNIASKQDDFMCAFCEDFDSI